MVSSQGYINIVRMLLDSGADVNAQFSFLDNILQVVLYNGYNDIV